MNKNNSFLKGNINSEVAESYRSLRTNILAKLARNPCRTLLVTSTLPREGKTTTLMNLGTALAQANKQVLLMDTDLRNPVLHKMMGIKPRRGITGLLADLLEQPVDQGVLKGQSLADIFCLLRLQERTGILTMENKTGRLEARFHSGEIVGFCCNLQQTVISRLANAGDYPVGDSPAADLPEWGRFLTYAGTDTSYHFSNTKMVTINSLDNHIHWKMLLDKVSILRQTVGIADKIKTYAQPTDFDGLWILPNDRVTENPVELLGSLAMRELSRILGNCFDIVLLDSPPAAPVTDASLMSSYLDGVIFVLRSKKVDRQLAISTIEKLQSMEANILGVVLNDINLESDHCYYRYYQRYYYGSNSRQN